MVLPHPERKPTKQPEPADRPATRVRKPAPPSEPRPLPEGMTYASQDHLQSLRQMHATVAELREAIDNTDIGGKVKVKGGAKKAQMISREEATDLLLDVMRMEEREAEAHLRSPNPAVREQARQIVDEARARREKDSDSTKKSNKAELDKWMNKY